MSADELRGDKTEVLVRLLTKLFYQGARPGAPAGPDRFFAEGPEIHMWQMDFSLGRRARAAD